MPTEGYESITISEETYKALKAFAEATHRSIPKAVEYLVQTSKKEAKKQ